MNQRWIRDGNIKTEDREALPIFQTSSFGCETGQEGKYETKD